MRKAWDSGLVDFDEVEMLLLPDLTMYTLGQWRALNPLLTLLKDHDISNRWGIYFFFFSGQKGR